MSRLIYGYTVDAGRTKDIEARAQEYGWTNLYWVFPSKDTFGEWRLYGEPPVETGDNHLVGRKKSPPATIAAVMGRMTAPSFDATSSTYVVDFGKGVGDSDGLPIIRSELGGLMGPGYQATGYEPPPRRQVLPDDPTGDDIAGDAP